MIRPNKIEINLEQVLLKEFPRYIPYREKYLTPLRGLPKNPNWRIDTHPDLEQIGVASYGVLKSINFINYRKNYIDISDFDQSFKNIYFHFGLVFDCIESLSRNIVLIEQSLNLIDIESKIRLTEQKLTDDFAVWIKNEYGKRFRDLMDKGKPIFYFPQNDHTYLSLIVDNPIKRTYYKFAKALKDYRNYFIHNPGVDIFKELTTGELFAINKEYVDKSKNWANLQQIFDRDKSYFENPIGMINSDLMELLSILNIVWEKIDERLNIIYRHENFEYLFKGFKREIEI